MAVKFMYQVVNKDYKIIGVEVFVDSIIIIEHKVPLKTKNKTVVATIIMIYPECLK